MAEMGAVLPAPAGMIPQEEYEAATGDSAPRTCGDDPAATWEETADAWCSPHLRG